MSRSEMTANNVDWDVEHQIKFKIKITNLWNVVFSMELSRNGPMFILFHLMLTLDYQLITRYCNTQLPLLIMLNINFNLEHPAIMAYLEMKKQNTLIDKVCLD